MRTRKTPLNRICPNCGVIFALSVKNPGTKYCCHGCSVEHLLKGKTKDPEHIKKISLNHARYWKNHKMSQEHIEKCITGLRAYQSGTNHWNWKGGITPILKAWRFKSEYSNWRNGVFKRDDFTCVVCKKRGGELQADHIVPWAKIIFEKNWSLIWDLSNGRTLCVNCHKASDTYAKRFYKS